MTIKLVLLFLLIGSILLAAHFGERPNRDSAQEIQER
jgi:hypothetical protein